MFAAMVPHRAMIANYITGWLILPVGGISLPGLPDITKATSVSFAALIGILLFDTKRLWAFRPKLIDLPMAVVSVVPMCSSISNGLGFYDGVSSSLRMVFLWGIPYYLGRIYFTNLPAIRSLAIGIFIGGLAYIPICVWEMRMGPTLHLNVYGFSSFMWHTAYRFGGYRPAGFLAHGIELGIWMMTASLIGVWLWATGSLKQLFGMRISYLAVPLLIVSILCRALGAWAMMIMGVGVLFGTRTMRTKLLIFCLVLVPSSYVTLRSSGLFTGEILTDMVSHISAQRASSLATRLENDGQLSAKALRRPLFGWGGWGRNRIYDEQGRNQSLTDGLWVIMMGMHGVVGLGSWMVGMLLPTVLLVKRLDVKTLMSANYAPVTVMAVLVPLYMMDWLMNGFPNPIYTVMVGAIVSILHARPPTMRVGYRYVIANSAREANARRSASVRAFV